MQISCRPVELVRITSLATSAGNRFASMPADAEWIQRSRLACSKSGSGKWKPKKTSASPISAASCSLDSAATSWPPARRLLELLAVAIRKLPAAALEGEVGDDLHGKASAQRPQASGVQTAAS